MDRKTSPRLANGAGSARSSADERGDGSKNEHAVLPTSAPASAPAVAPASRYEHDSERAAAAAVSPPADVPSAIAPEPNSTNDGTLGSPSSASSSPVLPLPPSPPDHMPEPPPYWSMPSAPRHRAQRSISAASYQSLEARPAAIHLEDRSSEDAHETARACWAHSVRVDEYVVVSGATGIGAYVVWHCTVRTLQGGDLFLRKRCILLNPEFAASPILKDFIFY